MIRMQLLSSMLPTFERPLFGCSSLPEWSQCLDCHLTPFVPSSSFFHSCVHSVFLVLYIHSLKPFPRDRAHVLTTPYLPVLVTASAVGLLNNGSTQESPRAPKPRLHSEQLKSESLRRGPLCQHFLTGLIALSVS